jgi:hypothetical protein
MGYIARANLRRKIKKDATPYERLKYKKNILFEFLEDINKNILRENKIEIIKEVFVKDLHFKSSKNKDNMSSRTISNVQSQKNKKSKSKVKSKAKEDDEEEENHSVYYGIYNSDVSLKRYFEVFKEDILSNNDPLNKKANFDIREDDGLDQSNRSLPPEESKQEKTEKTLETQKHLAIHVNHFKYLVRKVLFEKFQKMKIYVRQTFSQENQKIFLHLKIQGKV